MSINLLEFSALALAHFVALLSPGPDFFLIVGYSVRYGSRPTCWACGGIASANGVYILLALLGFSLLRENQFVFQLMKWLGAGYLLYIGSLLIRATQQEFVAHQPKASNQALSRRQLFLHGFLSAILNPKNMIFYLSLMTLIVSPQTNLEVQTVYGLWMFTIVLLWDFLIAWCIGNGRVRTALNRYSHRIEKTSGALLMLMGIFVLV